MATLTEVLPDDFVFVSSKKTVKRLANKLERKEVGGSAMSEYLDLDFDREAPRGDRRRIGNTETVKTQ